MRIPAQLAASSRPHFSGGRFPIGWRTTSTKMKSAIITFSAGSSQRTSRDLTKIPIRLPGKESIHRDIGSDESVDNLGNTILHRAILQTLNLDIIQSKLEKAPIDAPNRDGDTALILAARQGNYDKVELLLAYGADPTIQNHARMTALDVAKKRNEEKKDCLDVVRLLTNTA